jgi:hypothetical protein
MANKRERETERQRDRETEIQREKGLEEREKWHWWREENGVG